MNEPGNENEGKGPNRRDILIGSAALAGSTAVSSAAAGRKGDGEKSKGMIYINEQFKAFINRLYYPANNMEKSTRMLIEEKGKAYLSQMKWGDYQKILAKQRHQHWPGDTEKVWDAAVAAARANLSLLPNKDALSLDEANIIPPDKCALLDAAIRKCFSSTPPIPMTIDVEMKSAHSPDAQKHAIRLHWVYEDLTGPPLLLQLTMICPYGAHL